MQSRKSLKVISVFFFNELYILTFLIMFFLWLAVNEFVFPELTLLIMESHV